MIDLLRPLVPALSAAALFVVAASAQATEISPGSAQIGAFTLNYDPAEWRVDGAGDTFQISCSVDACSHAVVAVTISPFDEWCDAEVARRAAAAAFSWTTTHASNMYGRDHFALYFVSASSGWDPDNRYAAYACITHRGLRYEFVSKLSVGDMPGPFHAGSVFTLLNGLVAPAPQPIALDIGDLALHLTDDVWQTGSAQGEDGLWSITCLPPTCQEHVGVAIGANPVPLVGTCEAPARPDDEFSDPETATVGGEVPFTVTTYHSMCRAWTPPSVEACAVYNGTRYTISTGLPISGCYFGPYLPEGALLDLIEGITVE